MPSMCEITDFSSVLEIAFGLSAILYFIDIRATIQRKMEEASKEMEGILDILSQRPNPQYERIKEALETVPQDAKERFLARYPSSEQKARRILEKVRRRGDRPFAATAILSSLVSLATLFYSSFYPYVIIPCLYVAVILLLSYLSIIYNIFYFTIAVRVYQYILKSEKRRLGIE
jgi:hypothetical protein